MSPCLPACRTPEGQSSSPQTIFYILQMTYPGRFVHLWDDCERPAPLQFLDVYHTGQACQWQNSLMTELMEEAEPPSGSLAVLRAELDDLRRRVAVSDQQINLLQVEAAASKRPWYREPSVLVSTLALTVSVGTFIAGQR